MSGSKKSKATMSVEAPLSKIMDDLADAFVQLRLLVTATSGKSLD